MSIIFFPLFSVDVSWHLPEVLWHEATVTLNDTVSPTGDRIVRWQVDGAYDGDFAPSFVSADVSAPARLRVERHDGPRLVCVRITDTTGTDYSRVISRSRR